jgi:hypothetical protein
MRIFFKIKLDMKSQILKSIEEYQFRFQQHLNKVRGEALKN